MAFLWLSQRLACANTRWQKARQFSKRLQNQRQGLLVERYEMSMHSGSLGLEHEHYHIRKRFRRLAAFAMVKSSSVLLLRMPSRRAKSYTVLVVFRPHLQALAAKAP